MAHGDNLIRIALAGEPQKLLTYWRGSLRHLAPTSASVTITKVSRPRGRWQWHTTDPNFYFDAITRTENKRAVMSISEKSLLMQAGEIAAARLLTDLASGWLHGRTEVPHLDQRLPNARLSIVVEGSTDLVGVCETFSDPELVASGEVGVVFTQGEPRRPDVRWLPAITTTSLDVALGELSYFEKSLADGQAAEVRKIVDRIGGIFRKRLAMRRSFVNKRISVVLGYGATLDVRGQPMTDRMLEGYQYREILDYLDQEARPKKKRDDIRSWHA
jgi:hypothetical protein